LKRSCLIFCTSVLAVNQWAEQFLKWSDVSKKEISRFTSGNDAEWNPRAGVLITTYAMFSATGTRAEHSTKMIQKCKEKLWGLMILDEVHLAPASIFRTVTTEFKAHCKLGLTATMVREDDLVKDLPYLVGPTLNEVDILSLRNQRFIATVECYEIPCPMTDVFRQGHQTANSPEEKRLLFVTNPNKARVCLFLLKKHLVLNHKILVFCDDLFGLAWFSKVLKKDFIDGKTGQDQRQSMIDQFKKAKTGTFILFSKVGDHSIDLPEAEVVIQVCVVDGSRMQEAQRVGRVQRPAENKKVAYFYSLMSEGTEEIQYATKRKGFMEEHGYRYIELDYYRHFDVDTEDVIKYEMQDQLLDAIRGELQNRPAKGDPKTMMRAPAPKGSHPKSKTTTRDRLSKRLKGSSLDDTLMDLH